MQTFLPYADHAATAESLDRLRLGKQRVEVVQILRANLGVTKGWRSHPASRAWLGHEVELSRYGLAVCAQWRARGYVDNQAARLADLVAGLPDTGPPPWLGDERVHAAYRGLLLHKAPDRYEPLGWTDPPVPSFPWEILT